MQKHLSSTANRSTLLQSHSHLDSSWNQREVSENKAGKHCATVQFVIDTRLR